ncbi:DUF748 domain-containing protein [Nitrospiraceae bacterium HYJII51-Mn-bac16s-1-B09]|uniref:DUF748 domain-containing protein n=1 Tax=Candidatus Manganitrophus noduliformans TaxID=2606439 RepID=A0A7X6DUR6_9BACT|nr:DUF748 domain-containing protein [Candidatus Manganitrophus noduliformans]
MTLSKKWYWLIGFITVFVFILLIIGFFIDEPLRRYMEREANRNLKGYTVRIGALDFHPIGLSLDLMDVKILQEAHPTPPMASIQKASASLQWREILTGDIVSNWRIEHPIFHLNFRQAKKEAKDPTSVEERGWQEAIYAIYPVTINHFEIIDGEITYLDNSPLRQVRIHDLQFQAENIRNVKSEKNIYPSPVRLKATVLNTGKVKIDGHADFLSEPHLGVKGDLVLEQVNLEVFEPFLRHYNIAVRGGTGSLDGAVEFSPHTKVVELDQISLRNSRIDYIYSPQSTGTQKVEAETAQTAKEASETEQPPPVLFKINHLEINDSDVGFVNKSTDPDYRLYVTETQFRLTEFSNHKTRGTSEADLKGKWMGSGNLGVSAQFRPEKQGPDFDLAIIMEKAQLRSMNDLLRAYGNFDVKEGLFSFYMEVGVKQDEISGYVKPLFKDLKVYDKRQDKDKKLFRKLYEGLVGGISKLLENRPRDEVATQADISGKVEDPESSTWEVVVRLIRNAFFQAILPGFEREVSGDR